MINLSSGVIGAGGILFGFKETQMEHLFINSNLSTPFSSTLKQHYAFVTTSIGDWLTQITLILFFVAFAKILFSVIQGVMEFVVAEFICRIASHHLSVHVNQFTSLSPYCAKTLRVWLPMGAPIEHRQTQKIFYVNNRSLSLSESDESVRLVERLGYCVSFHAAFRHWSTSNGLLLPTAILSQVMV